MHAPCVLFGNGSPPSALLPNTCAGIVAPLQVWKDKNGREGVRPSAYDEPADWPKSCRDNFKEPVVERRGKGGGESMSARDPFVLMCNARVVGLLGSTSLTCFFNLASAGGYRGGGGYDRGGYDRGGGGGYDRGGYDRGGYDDRRGGYDDRRGGYDDRRYDDRRGGYDDRRYDDRRGGYDRR